jgi:hypothetical protein
MGCFALQQDWLPLGSAFQVPVQLQAQVQAVVRPCEVSQCPQKMAVIERQTPRSSTWRETSSQVAKLGEHNYDI